MTIELRGELDPAPNKRVSAAAHIEFDLTEAIHPVTIDGFEISVSIASGNTDTLRFDPGTVAGPITVSTAAEAEDRVDDAAQAMMVAAMRISDAIRTKQPSVGLVGQPPEFISFSTRKDGGNWRSYNYWPPSRPWYFHETVQTNYVVEALEHDVSLADRLLAQATYWSVHAAGNDPQTAVLLAAIACESHAKSTFQIVLEKRGDAALGEILFSRTPTSAADLYSKVADAVIGQSFKTAHPEVHKRLSTLFELRNKVAHTGTFGAALTRKESMEAAQTAVHAARAAISWLRTAAL